MRRANDGTAGRSRRPWSRFLVLAVLAPLALVPTLTRDAVVQADGTVAQNPVCARIGHSIEVSSGLQMLCFGSAGGAATPARTSSVAMDSNVDAASLAEDVAPDGTRGYGQSETSIAAIDQFVMEAWNDSTGFFAPCDQVTDGQSKEEGTGAGFSVDGGMTFTDMGGLPNTANCNKFRFSGDPSVEAYKSGGSDFFYISSLYPAIGSATSPAQGPNYIALTACRLQTTGSSCSAPIMVAQSSECESVLPSYVFCSLLDKPFMTIDPVRGRLYISYADFGINSFGSKIALAVCDISTTQAFPVCTQPSGAGAARSYYTLDPGTSPCESEGAYPAVNPHDGDVYVAWEHNWYTNIFGSTACLRAPVREVVAKVPFSCLTLTPVSPCTVLPKRANLTITSMDAASIPGYSRFPMNDFPRIAVSHEDGTVSIVWNDARSNPNGDILLQSFYLNSLAPVQLAPVRLNTGPANKWHFLPAMRQPNVGSQLDVTWYDRRLGSGAQTDVFAALHIDPLATSSPIKPNQRITSVSSDWLAASSDLNPNFGDYTDNYINPSTRVFQLYVAWSDGRLGEPQPFAAHTAA